MGPSTIFHLHDHGKKSTYTPLIRQFVSGIPGVAVCLHFCSNNSTPLNPAMNFIWRVSNIHPPSSSPNSKRKLNLPWTMIPTNTFRLLIGNKRLGSFFFGHPKVKRNHFLLSNLRLEELCGVHVVLMTFWANGQVPAPRPGDLSRWGGSFLGSRAKLGNYTNPSWKGWFCAFIFFSVGVKFCGECWLICYPNLPPKFRFEIFRFFFGRFCFWNVFFFARGLGVGHCLEGG